MPNGGNQRIITPCGHVVPLQVHSGLASMDLHKSTDAKLKDADEGGLPQGTLISNLDWVPASVDCEHPFEHWFDAMKHPPDLDDSASLASMSVVTIDTHKMLMLNWQ